MMKGRGGVWNSQRKKCMQTFSQKPGKEELNWVSPGIEGKMIFVCIVRKQILHWVGISGGQLRTQ
jgi:hypothetical protein